MFTHVLQSKLQDISKSLKWSIEFGQLITWLMKVVETSFKKHFIRLDLSLLIKGWNFSSIFYMKGRYFELNVNDHVIYTILCRQVVGIWQTISLIWSHLDMKICTLTSWIRIQKQKWFSMYRWRDILENVHTRLPKQAPRHF
jgi:hypothetical protein